MYTTVTKQSIYSRDRFTFNRKERRNRKLRVGFVDFLAWSG